MVTATQTGTQKNWTPKRGVPQRATSRMHCGKRSSDKRRLCKRLSIYQVFCAGLHTPGRELVVLRDAEKRFSGPKIDFPVPYSGQLMTAGSRV
jgi:hypothetical protein